MNYERLRQLILVGSEAREALFRSEEWCFHDTSVGNAWSIRSSSLEPRAPCVIDPGILSAVDSVMGERKGRQIVCLKTAGSATRGSAELFPCAVRLAVPKTCLSNRIGVDWSNLTAQLEIGKVKEGPVLDMFIEVVTKSEVFACYDAIDSSFLRVCPASNAISPPATWPLLKEVDHPAKMAAQF